MHTCSVDARIWKRYVATGDSITEGLGDPLSASSADAWRGWADRLALVLAHLASGAGERLSYANLAVRSRRVADVVDEQIPLALAGNADLVSIMVGANDLTGRAADPDKLATRLEQGVVTLRKVGCTVLLANCFDPHFAAVMRPFRGRAAVFNSHVWTIAATHGAQVIDLWGTRELQRPEMRSEDRVHLSPLGHTVVARLAADGLGIGDEMFTRSGASNLGVGQRSLPFHAWLGSHALPWVARRIRGRAAGDGRSPKRPQIAPLLPSELELPLTRR